MYQNRYSDDKFFFFWEGPFSQWARRDIVVHDVEYNCCEQYVMSAKARLFKDMHAYAKIMGSTSPKEQKAFGREVKYFDEGKWNAGARGVVYDANYAKFAQHKDLLEELRATGDRTIVEASPYDNIWGIGLHARDPLAKDPSKWPGKNWLGECIMEVRKALREEGKL